ncbi:MAG: ribonuclease Z, partial [Armatimonadota bacterium]|nr:ribonuclease Z [Armatimonadota bacterium]
AEAQAIFPNTFLAEDFWTYEIPVHRSGYTDERQSANHSPNSHGADTSHAPASAPD